METLNAYLFVGAVLFVCGVICMATKRNGIGILMGVELVLNGANVNFVAFGGLVSLVLLPVLYMLEQDLRARLAATLGRTKGQS